MNLPAKADSNPPPAAPSVHYPVHSLRDRLAQELTPAAVRPVSPPEVTATIVSTAARRFAFYMTGLVALALVFLFARGPASILGAVTFATFLFAWAGLFDGRRGS